MSSDEVSDPRSRLARMASAAADRAARLERSFDDIVEAAADVATDDEHDPEGHTIAWERQQVAALLDETRTALDDINQALQRLESGSYGLCTTCGEPITDARLEALPATAQCVNCAR